MNYVFQFGVVWKDIDLLLLGAWLTRQVPENADYLGRNLVHTRAQFDLALPALGAPEGW